MLFFNKNVLKLKKEAKLLKLKYKEEITSAENILSNFLSKESKEMR